MVLRSFLAGIGALAIAAGSAGSALADPVPPSTPAEVRITYADPLLGGTYLYYPRMVQVWSPAGLVRTISCDRVGIHPACDPALWPTNVHALMDEYGGYRLLSRHGRWFEYGGFEETYDKIEATDAVAGPGWAPEEQDYSKLDPYYPPSPASVR